MNLPAPTPAADPTAVRPFSAQDLQAVRHLLGLLESLPGLLDTAFDYVVTGAGTGILELLTVPATPDAVAAFLGYECSGQNSHRRCENLSAMWSCTESCGAAGARRRCPPVPPPPRHCGHGHQTPKAACRYPVGVPSLGRMLWRIARCRIIGWPPELWLRALGALRCHERMRDRQRERPAIKLPIH
jgi:hypothetical protein